MTPPTPVPVVAAPTPAPVPAPARPGPPAVHAAPSGTARVPSLTTPVSLPGAVPVIPTLAPAAGASAVAGAAAVVAAVADEILAQQIEFAIAVKETNEDGNRPNPRESDLSTSADIPASLRTELQQTLDHLVDTFKDNIDDVRSLNATPLTDADLESAHRRANAAGALYDAVERSTAQVADDGFRKAQAADIRRSAFTDEQLARMFRGRDLHRAVKGAIRLHDAVNRDLGKFATFHQSGIDENIDRFQGTGGVDAFVARNAAAITQSEIEPERVQAILAPRVHASLVGALLLKIASARADRALPEKIASAGRAAAPSSPLASAGRAAAPSSPLASAGRAAAPSSPLASAGRAAAPSSPLASAGKAAAPASPPIVNNDGTPTAVFIKSHATEIADVFIGAHKQEVETAGLTKEQIAAIFADPRRAAELRQQVRKAVYAFPRGSRDDTLWSLAEALPGHDLGFRPSSLVSYIFTPGNWGENRQAWINVALDSLTGSGDESIGGRLREAAVRPGDFGHTTGMSDVHRWLRPILATKPRPPLEQIVRRVARNNNPGSSAYPGKVWRIYQRLFLPQPKAASKAPVAAPGKVPAAPKTPSPAATGGSGAAPAAPAPRPAPIVPPRP